MCPLTLREGGETTEINASFEKHPTNAKILLCYPAGLWDIAGGIHCNYCRPHTHIHDARTNDKPWYYGHISPKWVTGRLYLGYVLLNLLARAGSNLNGVLWDVSEGTIVRKIHLCLLSIKLPIRKGTPWLDQQSDQSPGNTHRHSSPSSHFTTTFFSDHEKKSPWSSKCSEGPRRGMTPSIRDYRKKWTNLGKKTS